LLLVLSVLSVLVAGALGSVRIPIRDEVLILLDSMGVPGPERTWSESDAAILLQIRLPRVLGAFVVGSGLAAAGALMQGVFRNPLADPYILGSSAGAGLGVVLATALSLRWTALGFGPVPVLAFVGALAAIAFVYLLARVGWKTPTTHLLLSGIAVGSLLGAASRFVMLFSPALEARLQSVFVWLLGGVSLSGWTELRFLVPMLLVGLGAAWTLARPLDALVLGEHGAAHLGVSVERAKLLAIVTASFLTALSVSISGLVGFVGLIVPHAVRLVAGPRHRLLIPASALAGGAFLVLVDLLGRTIVAPNEVPPGLLTALLGAPFFLYLLRRGGREYAA
jgi:iron complex transport system permease protein